MGTVYRAVEEITQANLEGFLLTAKGELLKIEPEYPLDQEGVLRGYTFIFDPDGKRHFYDVVELPEFDPFVDFEKSLMSCHEQDTFMGRVHSRWGGMHEVYLVFKKGVRAW